MLAVALALLLAIIMGRSDLCIAGVFGAGKTRSLAVLLIALSCEVEDFSAVIFTKENVAAKALADQISDLDPPTRPCFGRLLGRIEEGKGEAYATRIDVRCNDRNRIITNKRILIATGGSTTAELSMRYSTFSQWLSKVWMAFMDESQQYNGGTTSLWFGLAACLGPLLRRHQKDLLQQRKYRSRCGSSLFCSRAKQFSPCLCRKASDVHVELGDVPEPKSCFDMFQGEYISRDPTSALLCLAFAGMNMNEHAAF